MTTKTRLTLSLLALLAASGCSTAPLQLSLWNPVQIVDEKEDVHGVRLTALYGKNWNITGVDIGLGVNECENMTGLLIGGIGSGYGGDMHGVHIAVLFGGGGSWGTVANGVQIAGLANVYLGDTTGVKIGGLFNMSSAPLFGGEMTGIQIAGLVNVSEETTGVQTSGLFNLYFGDVTGIQIAGLGNVPGILMGAEAFGSVRGIQASGLANITLQTSGVQVALFNFTALLKGVQISGLMGWCEKTAGVQVSGLVNVSEETTGVQIALVNRTKQLNGVQIGLINIVEDQWLPFVPFINFSFGRSDDAEQPPAPEKTEP